MKNSTAKPVPNLKNLFKIIDDNEIDYIREITTQTGRYMLIKRLRTPPQNPCQILQNPKKDFYTTSKPVPNPLKQRSIKTSYLITKGR